MAVQFKYVRVKFDSTKGRIQQEPGSVNFSRPVRRAGLAINGFKMKYTDKDHHVSDQRINLQESTLKISDKNVSFQVSFLLRDSSGKIDDRYEGWVDVLVIADVA